MLRSLASISHHYPTLSSSHHQPKTPPSTPSLEKGVPRSTSSSKRSKPGLYYAHEIRAWKRYTRFLHGVIALLVMVLVVGWWFGGCEGGEGEREGGLSLMPKWMGMGGRIGTMAEKEMGKEMAVEKSMTSAKDGNGDIVHAVQQCGILLKENEEGCLRRFNTVATSSSSSMGKGEREAWREVRDGLEALWRGLIESECKCHNPEMLDRMYEGLRERAGEMVGVRESEVLEG